MASGRYDRPVQRLAFALLTTATVTAAAQPPEPAGPLSLDGALQLARARHPRLRSAAAAVTASQAQGDAAFSPFLPQLGFTLGYQRATGNTAPRPGATANAPTENSFEGFNYFSASLTLNQLVWDFGQTLNRWRAAEAGLGAAQATLRAARLDVDAGVRAAFVGAAAAASLLRVAQQNLDAERRHLAQVEALVSAQLRPAVELAKSRALVASADAQRIAAEGGVQSALAQLRLAIGVDGVGAPALGCDPPPGEPDPVGGARCTPPIGPHVTEGMTLDALLHRAVAARPELQALALQEEAQRRLADAARGSYWPTFGVTLSITDAGTQLSELGWNMTAGIGLTWNFYQGGLTDAQVAQAEAIIEGLVATREQVVQTLRAELAQVLVDLTTAKGQAAAAAEALTQAREQVRLAEARYDARVGNAIELADAQTALANAATGQVVLELRLALARVRLVRALGEGEP